MQVQFQPPFLLSHRAPAPPPHRNFKLTSATIANVMAIR